VARLLATGLFVGYIPWASGTFGSLLGALIVLIPGATSPSVLLPLILAGFPLGTWAAWMVARKEGHALSRTAELTKSLFQKNTAEIADPSIVVIDEIVGMWISLAWLPPSFVSVATAFILFRLFDILKPEPARSVERLPYGLGIMLDDVVAGLYANLAARVILFIFHTLLPPAG